MRLNVDSAEHGFDTPPEFAADRRRSSATMRRRPRHDGCKLIVEQGPRNLQLAVTSSVDRILAALSLLYLLDAAPRK